MRIVQATVSTFDAETRTGVVLLDSGDPLPFGAGAFSTSGLRLLRVGQRVRLERSDAGDIVGLTIITMSPVRPETLRP